MTEPNALLMNPPSGKRAKRHRRHMDELLRMFAAKGTPLTVLAGSQYLARKVPTLRKYVRRLGLAFPDYTPRVRPWT